MDEHKFYENLQRYIDGELDEQERAEMDRLVADNPLYAMEVEREKVFTGILKKHLVREEAPYDLRERVVESLKKKQPRAFRLPQFGHFARPALVGLMAVLIFAGLFARNAGVFPVFAESITRHTDCLKGIYSMEILTSDPAEAARWFEGKLGFAVNPPDLSGRNARLIGARLCHLADKKVAFLTYEYEGRRISAFFMDVRHMKVPKSEKIEMPMHTIYAKSDMGYQSILCLNKKVEGVGCVFVSDIPQEELIRLVM